jgi:hypothetical protein
MVMVIMAMVITMMMIQTPSSQTQVYQIAMALPKIIRLLSMEMALGGIPLIVALISLLA